jgi:ATP-binding cassette, subfamily B, bacterial MsbA
MSLLRAVLQRAGWLRLAEVVFLVLFANLAEIIGLSLFIPIIDFFLKGGTNDSSVIQQLLQRVFHYFGTAVSIPVILVLLSTLFLLKALLLIGLRWLSVHTAASIQHGLRCDLYEQVLSSPINYVYNSPQGVILGAITEHSLRTGQSFFILSQIIAQVVTVFAYAVFVVLLSWKLTLVAVASGLLLGPCFRFFNRKAHDYGKAYSLSFERLQQTVLEGLRAKKIANAMNLESDLLQMFSSSSLALGENWKRMAFWSNVVGVVAQPFSVVIISLVIWLSIKFEWSPALLGTFALALMRLVPSLQGATGLMGDLQALTPSIGRVSKLLNETKSTAYPLVSGRLPYRSVGEGIRLQDVRFSYPGQPTVFDRLSLFIPAGKITALIGPNGAGKTTLSDLVLGLYRPAQGRILVGGLELSQIELHQFRSRVAYISQEPVFFNASIRKNLVFGLRRTPPDEELLHVCRLAGALDFITARSEGIELVIGENGLNLSGGQRQRLALSRALLRKPEIMILDEATSSLDIETERLIAEILREIRREGRVTILIIAHRYTTTQVADQIYVIRGGHATLLGSWDQVQQQLISEPGALDIEHRSADPIN